MTEHDAGHQDTKPRQGLLQDLLTSRGTQNGSNNSSSNAPDLGIADATPTTRSAADNNVRNRRTGRNPYAAESSSTAAFPPTTTTTTKTTTTTAQDNSMLTLKTFRNSSLDQPSSPVLERHHHNTAAAAKVNSRSGGGPRQRSHKNRSSSAFLLSGPLFDGTASDPAARDSSLWQRQGLPSAANAATRARSSLPVSSPMSTTPDLPQHARQASNVARVPASKQPFISKSDHNIRQRPTSAAQRLDTSLISRPSGSTYSSGFATQGDGISYEDHANNHFNAATPVLPPGTASSKSSSSSARQSLDMDSTQIVNMALSLSESRRFTARQPPQAVPPSLTPTPDSALGGSLRQHLQQQRRSSRNISPKANRIVSAASAVSAHQQPRITSPLQASFDMTGDSGGYRYQFSQSTLARAQKAKEHLELLAQYRRVLDLVPALKPGHSSRSGTADPAGVPSAVGPGSPGYMENEFVVKLGRQYNPLQYIRNRKVRARERKTIDGDAQGFGDSKKVAEWVDQILDLKTTRGSGNATLVAFEPAEKSIAKDQKNSPAAAGASANGPMASSKSKRPRVDWVTNPADLLADFYWLEQADNKKYVEDRHYKRVFPQGSGHHRPWSQQRDHGPVSPTHGHGGAIFAAIAAASAAASSAAAPAPTTTIKEALEQGRSSTSSEHRPSSGDVSRYGKEHRGLQHAPSTAREKLQKLRGLHHRHSSSVQSSAQDFLRLRRGSLSDESDSESGPRRKRPTRTNTITANGRDALEKQMLDMIAQENRNSLDQQAAVAHPTDTNKEPPQPRSNPTARSTPERVKSNRGATSRLQSSLSSRDNLVKDLPTPAGSNNHGKPDYRPQNQASTGPVSPASPGRESLDVPNFWGPRQRRISIDYDSSQPTSPDLRAVRGTDGVSAFVLPPIGKDLSPTHSRSGSPSRNPFSRVRQKLQRERSRSRVRGVSDVSRDLRANTPGVYPDEKQGGLISPGLIESPPRALIPPEHLKPSPAPKEKNESPVRKLTVRTDSSHHKLQKSQTGDLKREDSGLRGFFSKGPPRIDSVLRSGVSKVGELLWRKESSTDQVSPAPKDSENAAADTASSDSEDSDTDAARGRKRWNASHRDNGSRKNTDKRDNAETMGKQSVVSPGSTYLSADVADRDGQHSPGGGFLSPDLGSPLSRQISRRSSRFELLKPPKLDVQAATPTTPGLSPVFHVQETESSRREDDDGLAATEGRGNISAVSWPPSAPFPSNTHGLDRREVLRQSMRALRTGIMAAEIAYRGLAVKDPSPNPDNIAGTGLMLQQQRPYPLPGIAAKHRDQALAEAGAMQQLAEQWHQQSEIFATRTAPSIVSRIDALRYQVAVDLSSLVRAGADEADNMGRDLVDGQRQQVKRVVDTIEKLLRRRRRRFRWIRRAGWLAVEWWLVGFMWFVWAVVVVARVFLGLGSGVVGVGRWLLWL